MRVPSYRQTIALLLLTGFVIALLFAAGVNTPSRQITKASSPAPRVLILSTFSAKGSLSAGNPITVSTKVIINGSHPPSFCCVAYYGSSFQNGAPYNSLRYTGTPAYVTLSTSFREGNFTAFSGQEVLVWAVESPTYAFLIPYPPDNATSWRPSSNESALLSIGDVSQTLNWQFAEISTRLTFVLIAFSVPLLQPLLGALIGERRLNKPRHIRRRFPLQNEADSR